MIVGLLAWWDEPPAWLTRCIVPLGRFCDHLIAIDGAYAAVPGAELKPSSPGPQADAVVAAAEAAGLGLTLHRPSMPWAGGEVAKRSVMFSLTGVTCESGDWLFVIDADEIVRDVPGDVGEQLASFEEDVATVEFQDGAGIALDRRFVRWNPLLRVEGNHFTWTAGNEVLRGDGSMPCAHINGFRVEHLQSQRDPERRATQLGYYGRRDRLGLETTTRRTNGESAVFAFEPREGSRHFAMVVSPDEFSAVKNRGYAELDEQRAAVVFEDCDEASGFMRFYLDEPYRKPVSA